MKEVHLREVNSFLIDFLLFFNSSLYTSPLISKENINAEMCAFKNRDGLGLPWPLYYSLVNPVFVVGDFNTFTLIVAI